MDCSCVKAVLVFSAIDLKLDPLFMLVTTELFQNGYCINREFNHGEKLTITSSGSLVE